MIGTRLGPYEIIEEVGQGGMATVYRAYHPTTDRYVAVKVIHQSISTDAKAVERFQREARLVAHLEHPHILPIHDYDGQHIPPYIVMRYLESGTLKDVLEKAALPLVETAYIMRQITSALDYAHRQGVIHRDIKPSNIMIDSDGNAFLTDFGIARLSATGKALTQTGFAVGTPGYMAPEQAMDMENIDARADIYSLGAMLFEMLTGDIPYNDSSPMRRVMDQIQKPIPSAVERNPELPAEVDDVLRRAMAKEPEDRYATGGDLTDDLMKIAGDITSSRVPTGLRRAAQLTLEQMQKSREERKDEINKTEQDFQAQRHAAPTTSLPKTDERATDFVPSQPAIPTLSTPRWILPVMTVSILLLVAIGAFALFSDQSPLIQRTSTPTDSPTLTTTSTEVPDTATVQAIIIVPTDTPTRTPEDTLSPTDTRTPTSLPTPSTPELQVRRVIPVYAGPGIEYAQISTLELDDVLDVRGVSEDREWYRVRLPNGVFGWVANTSAVRVAGDTSIIPVLQAPTFTPTNTPTPTDTATRTPTRTPTASRTPTEIPTQTPTLTPTDTLTPTNTPSITPTSTNTATPTPTLTETPTSTPTPTPIPGSMPFAVDFEGGDADLADWGIYNTDNWYVDEEDGNHYLRGVGGFSDPIVVLGGEQPAWLDSTDLVISFRLYLERVGAGARIVFRSSDLGHEALEIFPDDYIFRHYEGSIDPSNSAARSVRPLTTSPRTISRVVGTDVWRDIVLWIQGDRAYVFMDSLYLFSVAIVGDNFQSLIGGNILLQSIEASRGVRFDDLVIQQALSASNPFATLAPWQELDPRGEESRIINDSTSSFNSFIRVSDTRESTQGIGASTEPAYSNVDVYCRMQIIQGSIDLRLRDTSGAEVVLRFSAGNLLVQQSDPAQGGELDALDGRNPLLNFYGVQWIDYRISVRGNQLTLYKIDSLNNSETASFAFTLAQPFTLSGIEFATVDNRQQDEFILDYCLLTGLP